MSLDLPPTHCKPHMGISTAIVSKVQPAPNEATPQGYYLIRQPAEGHQPSKGTLIPQSNLGIHSKGFRYPPLTINPLSYLMKSTPIQPNHLTHQCIQ